MPQCVASRGHSKKGGGETGGRTFKFSIFRIQGEEQKGKGIEQVAAFNSFALLRNPPPSLRASCRLRAKKSFLSSTVVTVSIIISPNFPIGTYTVASFGESLSEPSHWARNIWGGRGEGRRKRRMSVHPSW